MDGQWFISYVSLICIGYIFALSGFDHSEVFIFQTFLNFLIKYNKNIRDCKGRYKQPNY